MAGEHGNVQQSRDWSRNLRAPIFNYKHKLEVREAILLSKPTPSDVVPPARPQLLNLPKRHHQLGTQWSNLSGFPISLKAGGETIPKR